MCNPIHDDETKDNTTQYQTNPVEADEVCDQSKTENETQAVQENVAMETDETKHFEQALIDPSLVDQISAKIDSLESLFKKRLTYDESKERIIDKLHAELQDYKSDLYFQLIRPIMYDIVVVLDDIRKLRLVACSEGKTEADSLAESMSESLLYLLEKYEVVPFSSEINAAFDATKQRMVATKPTDDDSLVGLIDESVFSGFTQKNRLVFPEKVVVYKRSSSEE